MHARHREIWIEVDRELVVPRRRLAVADAFVAQRQDIVRAGVQLILRQEPRRDLGRGRKLPGVREQDRG